MADEPVSALDVSVQAAVTELLMDIQRKNRTTMLFIATICRVVRYLADRVVVMYLGRIVERADRRGIFAALPPYTEALLSAMPIADTRVRKKHIVLEGEIPSALNLPRAAPFIPLPSQDRQDLRTRRAAARVRDGPPDPMPSAARPNCWRWSR